MSGNNWERVQEIFFGAVDLPVSERDAYLERACGGDAGLRSEVESLLQADAASGSAIAAAIGSEAGALLDDHAPLAGTRMGAYRLLKEIGRGGMGSVFLAEQIALGGRRVALKVLSRRLLDDPEFLERFHNEGISTARIQHHNVVTIHDSGQADDGTPYIAMEFLEGGSLREALKIRGALSLAECEKILRQAARGLNAAHKLGIIHRDLKPDNIFLTYSDDAGAPLVGAQDVGAPLVGIGARISHWMLLGEDVARCEGGS